MPNAARRRYSYVDDTAAQHVSPGACHAVAEHPEDHEHDEHEQGAGQGAMALYPPSPGAAAGGGGSSKASGPVAVMAAALAGVGAGPGAGGVSSPHQRVEMASADWHGEGGGSWAGEGLSNLGAGWNDGEQHRIRRMAWPGWWTLGHRAG